MNAVVAGILSPFIGTIAGIIAHNLYDHIDDVKEWTAKLPDWAKQGVVTVIASAIPLLNAKFGLSIPADPSNLLTEPSLQALIATAIAFLLKGAKKKARA